jgi:hypothetical protein
MPMALSAEVFVEIIMGVIVIALDPVGVWQTASRRRRRRRLGYLSIIRFCANWFQQIVGPFVDNNMANIQLRSIRSVMEEQTLKNNGNENVEEASVRLGPYHWILRPIHCTGSPSVEQKAVGTDSGWPLLTDWMFPSVYRVKLVVLYR